jgi:hypothetical protein
MNNIEINATALNIGKALQREDWYKMSADQAEDWCIAQCDKRGICPEQAEVIAMLAMNFVIANR